MQKYSHFFSVIYDQPEPVGNIGRGNHYTVARVVEADGFGFMDFAIIWDEDHDTRVIWVIEKMISQKLIARVVAVEEKKGCLTIITRGDARGTPDEREIKKICESMPSDWWEVELIPFRELKEHVSSYRYENYLLGIRAQHGLDFKALEFTWPDEDAALEERLALGEPKDWMDAHSF